MYCLSACHVLLCVILYQQTPVVYLQTLTLTQETSPLMCEKEVTLKCSYSGPTCCTDDARVWTRSGTQIMFNGAASDNTKYEEERNDTGFHFNMKILKLDDQLDFGDPFQCQYNFLTSNAITLIKDDTFECLQNVLCSIDVERSGSDKINVKGSLVMEKTAPSPLLYAFYGDKNLTSGLSIAMVNYDTWYYNITVNMPSVDCKDKFTKRFTVTAVTGTTSTEICDINLCECGLCGIKCIALSISLPVLLSSIPTTISVCVMLGKLVLERGSEPGEVVKITVWYLLLCFLINLVIGLAIGFVVCPCNENLYMMFFLMVPMITGVLAIVILDRFFKFDYTYLIEKRPTCNIALLVFLWFISCGTTLLIACAINVKWFKDGKNRSTESGSPEKERADKKKDRKPTEVVRPQPSRPQPSRAQHLKTDNTGRAEYSTETEIYKPRPLPSISRPSDSPRPLPKRTPDDQLEKGGIQLEPLVDSTSEKKKKKKRKKKETKQSDEEN